jgi:hypothetical protein
MFVNSDPAIHQEYVRKLISQQLTEANGNVTRSRTTLE